MLELGISNKRTLKRGLINLFFGTIKCYAYNSPGLYNLFYKRAIKRILKDHTKWIAAYNGEGICRIVGRIRDLSGDSPNYYRVRFCPNGGISIGCQDFTAFDVLNVKNWLNVK